MKHPKSNHNHADRCWLALRALRARCSELRLCTWHSALTNGLCGNDLPVDAVAAKRTCSYSQLQCIHSQVWRLMAMKEMIGSVVLLMLPQVFGAAPTHTGFITLHNSITKYPPSYHPETHPNPAPSGNPCSTQTDHTTMGFPTTKPMFLLLTVVFTAHFASTHAYDSGFREKSIMSGQINVYGLDAGVCSVTYNLVCHLPCYASVMSVNQMQSFSDGLFKPLTGVLCTNNGRAAPGAVTNCSDTVPLNYGQNCGNFQGYQIAVYFNASAPDGSELDTDYTLQWTSMFVVYSVVTCAASSITHPVCHSFHTATSCPADVCPNPSATS